MTTILSLSIVDITLLASTIMFRRLIVPLLSPRTPAASFSVSSPSSPSSSSTCVRINRHGSLLLDVLVKPSAKQCSATLGGTANNNTATACLQVRVNSAPIEGAANKALCAYLATTLHLRKSSVRVVQGMTSRQKVVEIDSDADRNATTPLTVDSLMEKLEATFAREEDNEHD